MPSRRALIAAVSLAALAALAACAACKGKSSEPAPGSASGTAAAGSDPWASKAGSDASTPAKPPAPPASKEQRAADALARVAAIKIEIAKVRGLAFEHDVPTGYQTAADFREFVRRGLAKELPPEKSKAQSAALYHLGFMDKPVDLATVVEQAVTTQAGAYYDPEAKKFFLVVVPDNQLLLDTLSAHELTHALQDQHFDLARYMLPTLDDDAAIARRFVVEGDATLAMLVYGIAHATGKTLDGGMEKLVHAQVQQFASMDITAMKQQTLAQAGMLGLDADGEIKRAMDAIDDIPLTVLAPLFDSYSAGALVAVVAYEHGGWSGVDALFKDPPQSSEQVLHPETKLYPRDPPRKVTLAKIAGADELTGNVMGELQWQVYFRLWSPSDAARASEGWGGDRYTVVRRKDGRLVGEMATVWDSPKDAEEFATAYAATLAKRFPGAAGDPATGVARPDGGKVFVARDGDKVFIVDGADDAAALDTLERTAKFD